MERLKRTLPPKIDSSGVFKKYIISNEHGQSYFDFLRFSEHFIHRIDFFSTPLQSLDAHLLSTIVFLQSEHTYFSHIIIFLSSSVLYFIFIKKTFSSSRNFTERFARFHLWFMGHQIQSRVVNESDGTFVQTKYQFFVIHFQFAILSDRNFNLVTNFVFR